MSAARLFRVRALPISALMNARFSCCLTLALLLALPAAAVESKKPTTAAAAHATAAAGPKSIGKFEDWTAATHQESGAPVCYAFTRVQSSAPTLPGRGPVVLTVTERASGRDAVAIEAGFAYAANAAVTVQVDQTGLEFYTAGRDAFARDGKAAVAAFGKGSRAIARSPAPKEVTDTFSLKGFGDAYKAIVKACPAK
jgi:Invasion associated locus B (IalB) protein